MKNVNLRVASVKSQRTVKVIRINRLGKSVPNFVQIHQVNVELIQSEPKPWTNQVTYIAMESVAKNVY